MPAIKPAPLGTSTCTACTCPVCKQPAYRNRSGLLLMHTITVPQPFPRSAKAEICPGYTRKARP